MNETTTTQDNYTRKKMTNPITGQIPGVSVPQQQGQQPGAMPGVSVPGQPGQPMQATVNPGSDFSGGDPLDILNNATPAEPGGGSPPEGDYWLALTGMELIPADPQKADSSACIKCEFLIMAAGDPVWVGKKAFKRMFLSAKSAPYTRRELMTLGIGNGAGPDVRAAIAAGSFKGNCAQARIKPNGQYYNLYINTAVGRYPVDAMGNIVAGSQPTPF